MTTTPRARAASASRRMFSTTCLRAGMRRRAGIGEGAALADDVVLHVLNDERAAPRVERRPSASEAGGRGWRSTLGEQRRARRRRPRGHVGLVAAARPWSHRVDRVGRGHEQRAEIRRRPRSRLATSSGTRTLPSRSPLGRVDPDAARRRHPDIAALIAFHAVGHALLEFDERMPVANIRPFDSEPSAATSKTRISACTVSLT